jgi:hypothetical protein
MAVERSAAAVTTQLHRRAALHASRWVALAAACTVAIALGIAFPHQIAHQIALSTTREPTPFTELYFSDPNSLPRLLSISRPNIFGFTVVNHEGRSATYSYVVTLASSHGASSIAHGRVDVKDNEHDTIVISMGSIRRATQYSITVSLLGRSEAIWFRAVSQ